IPFSRQTRSKMCPIQVAVGPSRYLGRSANAMPLSVSTVWIAYGKTTITSRRKAAPFLLQTVWKLSLKGSVLRLGWGNLPYGTHSRSRPLADAALAGDGGRLRRPGQSGAVHRGLRGWARLGGGRLCSGRTQTDRSAGLCAG